MSLQSFFDLSFLPSLEKKAAEILFTSEPEGFEEPGVDDPDVEDEDVESFDELAPDEADLDLGGGAGLLREDEAGDGRARTKLSTTRMQNRVISTIKV